MTALPYTNFTKGELAPELHARIDTSQYGAGAKRVRNFIIQRYGGLSFRPGFRLVLEADNTDKEIRYVPFQYNIEQSYIMVLEDQTLRLLTKGGAVLEQDLEVTAVTKAINAQVTAAFHGLAVGDRVYFSGLTGMTQLNGLSATVVSVIDANNFTIDVNTTGFGTFIASTGEVRVGAPAPPPAPEPPPPTPAPPPEDPPTTNYEGPGPDYGALPTVPGQELEAY